MILFRSFLISSFLFAKAIALGTVKAEPDKTLLFENLPTRIFRGVGCRILWGSMDLLQIATTNIGFGEMGAETNKYPKQDLKALAQPACLAAAVFRLRN